MVTKYTGAFMRKSIEQFKVDLGCVIKMHHYKLNLIEELVSSTIDMTDKNRQIMQNKMLFEIQEVERWLKKNTPTDLIFQHFEKPFLNFKPNFK